MHFAGRVPADLPDPADLKWAEVARMPSRIFGLVGQPHIEEIAHWSISSADGFDGRSQMDVSISYTLWRHPEDRDDPRNLADLDPATAAALDAPPPRDLPQWIIDGTARMRFPMLWEAVRTSWRREDQPTTLHETLVQHLRYIVANRVPGVDGMTELLRSRPELDDPSALAPCDLSLDGRIQPGVRIDADEHAVGFGIEVDDVHLTAVILRTDLPSVDVAFATRWEPTHTVGDGR